MYVYMYIPEKLYKDVFVSLCIITLTNCAEYHKFR